MRAVARFEVRAALWLQKNVAVAPAIFGIDESQLVPVLRVGGDIVERGDRARRIAKRRMRRDIVDPLAADVDLAASIREGLKITLPGSHRIPLQPPMRHP